MDLYKRIADIFEISSINIDKANRRTLLRYAKRVEFQKRREVFYSICPEGKKSKVAICKTDERPQWVHNLDTLKTKALRVQLKTFLKELGAFVDPKRADLKKLARTKNWDAVIKMQDEGKTGGSGRAVTGFVRDQSAGRGAGRGAVDPNATPVSGRGRARMRRASIVAPRRSRSRSRSAAPQPVPT